MTRLPLAAILSLSALAACTVKNTSSNPEDGNYDGYHNDPNGGGGGAGGDGDAADAGDKPKVRTMTSTRAAPARAGKSLAARKPPVTGGDKPRPARAKPSAPSQDLALDGFYPTNAPAGSIVEILGTGFGSASQTTVTIGGKRQRVVEVGEGYMVVAVAGSASGPITLARTGRAKAGGQPVKSDSSFNVVPLGSPRTDAAHGLVANVYSIASPVTELPAADTLGEPIGTFAVDNLDIASTQFKGAFKGGGKDVSEWFAVHFRGSLNVTEAGTYDLCLNSGDGALLFLDQTPIVDNDGVHDTKETCESIAIEPGEYQLDLMWFQAEAGELGLQLLWAKDGGARAPIPRANLFPPEDVATMARR